MDITEAIEWESSQSHILLNPRMPLEEKKQIIAALASASDLKSTLFLSTSGSSETLKYVALSKEAILSSAAAVNRHLASDSSDIWLNPLPIFHVGGLGIQARGYLTGAQVVAYRSSLGKWSPYDFVEQVTNSKATLTALVPAQIFDIVKENYVAPQGLRAVIIGGGALPEAVYHQAIALGWKLLPSYGLTECASQVATASLDSWKHGVFPLLHPLDHIQLSIDQEGLLRIKSGALLSFYVFPDLLKRTCYLIDPKVGGWLTTEDRAVLINGFLKTVSRGSDFIKIGGESVNLLRLDHLLEESKLALNISTDMSLVAVPDARLGHVIHLAVAGEASCDLDGLLKDFHSRVHPYERVRHIYYVTHIPRSPLQKVRRHLLAFTSVQ